LLDDDLCEVAPGEIGEVGISGVSISAGYLNASEMSSARFTTIERDGISVPVYRTGDRGQLTPDGDLVVVGRVDAQVKIRGNRVDLGDVERAMLRSNEVRDAMVVATPNDAGELVLEAFVIPATDRLDIKLLREYLLATLPKVMIPTQFVEVPAFPLNPNGKVDRRALQDRLVDIKTAKPHQAGKQITGHRNVML
jgi:non-ribosomal peptide synthetase component E (peptide arylation enzyme)